MPFSCASLPGKGIHYATKLLRTYLAEDSENTQFCYKFDIKKFYANIDHEILKKLLAKKIRDKKLLRLLAKIIDSKNTVDLNDLILTSEEREIYS